MLEGMTCFKRFSSEFKRFWLFELHFLFNLCTISQIYQFHKSRQICNTKGCKIRFAKFKVTHLTIVSH